MGTAHMHHSRTSSRNSRRSVEATENRENGVVAAPVVVTNGIMKVPSTNYASSYGDERTVKKLRLSKALTIPEELTVADACRRMAHRRVGAVMLSDSNGLLSGIITDKDIAVRVVADGLDPEHTLVSKIMTRNPVFVTMDTHAIDALQEMVRGKFRHLPVVENGEAIAILDITKCLYDAISRMEKAAEQGSAIAAAVEGVERQWGGDLSAAHYAFIETLRERMFKPTLSSIAQNTPIELVAPSDSVYLAAKKMKENHATAVIVMIGGKPQGILTSRDVLMRVVARNLSPEHVAVEKIMTAHPECATMDTKILDALHIMQEGKFLHLPIVDHGGSIIACVNVLQVTHAAISLVDGGSELVDDMATSMIQKFWDSTLALELPDEQIETQSERSTSMVLENSGETCKYIHPSIVDANTFVFKYEDHEGRMHRFSCGTKSIRALRAAVMDRVLPEHYEYNALLMYIDNEGDKILLETNGDLADAVDHARSAGWKVIRLQLEKSVKEQTTSNSAETQRGGMTSLHVSVLTGVVLIAGISVIVYLRRSNL